MNINNKNITEHGISIIEHDGKLYFSDEFQDGILTHPLYIPESESK